MTNQDMFFRNAELSLGAYAALDLGPTNTNRNLTALVRAEMSLKQAEEFAARYPTVVTSFDDGTTGFQATVFKDTAGDLPGNLTVAFRGTTIPEDLPTGANIVTAGAAYQQIVAMFNWWQRVTSAEGDMVAQYRIVPRGLTEQPPSNAIFLYPGAGVLFYLEAAPDAEATGALLPALSGDADSKVDLTGHSLGGHLSMAFSSLFATRTGQVTVFNAPGFVDSATNQAFFGMLGGVIPASASITNVAADESLVDSNPFNWIAGMHSRPGTQINVAIEKQTNSDEANPFTPGLNHSIVALTDSLAVFNLLSTLSPTITTSDYRAILAAAAMGTAASYERVVDALETLIGTDNQPMPVGNNQRESLYSAIAGLHAAIDDRSLFGTVSILPLTTVDAAGLIQGANGLPDAAPEVALAYRYALKELNPFIVTGNAGIYALHNLNGELDLYDPVNRTGTLTGEWITDRAAFLTWKNAANTDDVTTILRPEFADGNRKRFDDISSRYSVTLSNAVLPPNDDTAQRFVFGGDSADALYGGAQADRLYGGAGTDYLWGKAGFDYLEGGSGRDIYQYSGRAGLGVDNDGADTIRDTDGKGVLRYTFFDNPGLRSTVIIDAFVRVSDNEWKSADGNFIYTRTTNSEGRTDLTITIDGDAGGSITLKDWREGDFGIHLRDYRPEFDIGNVITSDSENISGTAANDLIVAGDSGNHIQGLDGHDLILGGGGRDRIVAGPGNDIVEGGPGDSTGGDIIDGGAGDDVLYGESAIAWHTAILNGRIGTGTGLRGDWLSGGDGSDVLVAGAGNDLLVGGRGADLLIGGAGDDNIGGGASWVATSFDWSYEELGDNTRAFFPIIGEDAPVDDEGDVAYGGAGHDYIWGGYGDDVLFGEDGDDYLGGQWGDDILVGGDGADVLEGDDPYFTAAEFGHDYLDGGAGNDVLFGYGGDDVLVGGPGNDVLVGGDGKDIYIFNKGDGADTVFDDSTGVETSVMVFGEGFDRSALTIHPGSLILDFGEGDSVHLANFDVYDPNSTPAFESLSFADGSSMSFDEVIALGFDFDGTEENDDGHDAAHPTLIGTAFDDRLRGHGGHDTLIGLQGNDTLDGGAGNDQLFGDEGDDTLDGGAGSDRLIGADGDDRLLAGADRDALWGGAGNDYLEGGGGKRSLRREGEARARHPGEKSGQQRGGRDVLAARSRTILSAPFWGQK